MAEIEVALGAETAVEPLSAGSDGDVIAPLLLLDGHVCPLSLGNAGQVQGLSLRNPYHWESHTGASAYILPKWMWRVVGGDAVSWIDQGGRTAKTPTLCTALFKHILLSHLRGRGRISPSLHSYI